MNSLVIAGIIGALAVGGLALFCWYRARQLEHSTERLLARISSDIDQLVLRTLREQNRHLGPHAPQQLPRPGHFPGHSPEDSLSRAA